MDPDVRKRLCEDRYPWRVGREPSRSRSRSRRYAGRNGAANRQEGARGAILRRGGTRGGEVTSIRDRIVGRGSTAKRRTGPNGFRRALVPRADARRGEDIGCRHRLDLRPKRLVRTPLEEADDRSRAECSTAGRCGSNPDDGMPHRMTREVVEESSAKSGSAEGGADIRADDDQRKDCTNPAFPSWREHS